MEGSRLLGLLGRRGLTIEFKVKPVNLLNKQNELCLGEARARFGEPLMRAIGRGCYAWGPWDCDWSLCEMVEVACMALLLKLKPVLHHSVGQEAYAPL